MLNGTLGKYRCACGLVFPNSQQKASHCKHCETHKLRKAEQIARAVQSAGMAGGPLATKDGWNPTPPVSSTRRDALAALRALQDEQRARTSPDLFALPPSPTDLPSKRRKLLHEMGGAVESTSPVTSPRSPTRAASVSDTIAASVALGRARRVVVVVGNGASICDGNVASRHPTAAHLLVRLLHDRGQLVRCYSANFDNLERGAGVPSSCVVSVHESSRPLVCPFPSCGAQYPPDEARCLATPMRCRVCGSALRPGFLDLADQDLAAADAVLFLGASLRVHPMPMLFNSALLPSDAARIVIGQPHVSADSFMPTYRDVELPGNCQLECSKLIGKLGWKRELRALTSRYSEQCRLAGIAVPNSFATQYNIGETVYVMLDFNAWAQGVVDDILEVPFSQCLYHVSQLSRGTESDVYVTTQRLCPLRTPLGQTQTQTQSPSPSSLASIVDVLPIVIPKADACQPQEIAVQLPAIVESASPLNRPRMSINFLLD